MSETGEKKPGDKPANFNDAGEYIGPESLVVTCSRPIKLHKTDPNMLNEFTLYEPTVEQMSAYQDEENKTRNPFKAGAILISKNAEISLPLALKLSTRDFAKAIEFLTGFIPPGPKDDES